MTDVRVIHHTLLVQGSGNVRIVGQERRRLLGKLDLALHLGGLSRSGLGMESSTCFFKGFHNDPCMRLKVILSNPSAVPMFLCYVYGIL